MYEGARVVADSVTGALDPATVLEVARAAAGVPLAESAVTECRSIYRPRVAGTLGVYRVAGAGRVATALSTESPPRLAWAAVLKVLAPAADGGLPFEAALYASGVLAALPGPLIAPRCYGVTPLPSGGVGVWLECLRDDVGSPWPLAQYARTAHHLGHLPGASAQSEGGARHATAWLATLRTLGAVQTVQPRAGADAWEANIARLREHRRHPRVQRAYPPAVQTRLEALWQRREALLDALAACPHAISHGDAQRNNLFARNMAGRAGRGARTVAIDWANLRRAPVGTDAATLLHQDLVHLRVDVATADRLDRHVFGGYWRGLRASGWRGDRRRVRLAYALQLALVYGLHDLRPGLDLALDEDGREWDKQAERYGGCTVEEVLDRRAAVTRFLLDLADEVLADCG
jgi:hypothetical protein